MKLRDIVLGVVMTTMMLMAGMPLAWGAEAAANPETVGQARRMTWVRRDAVPALPAAGREALPAMSQELPPVPEASALRGWERALQWERVVAQAGKGPY